MIYAFRIRPLARLFLIAVLVWLAFTCMRAARVVPTGVAIVLVVAGGLFLLSALTALLGLSHLARACGRTWTG
jgi:hypothetical protein